MILETPIVIPAVPQETFDKFLADNISIKIDERSGKWVARYTKKFYKEVDGKKVFAPTSTFKTKEVFDVLKTAETVTEVADAFTAIETAIQKLEE